MLISGLGAILPEWRGPSIRRGELVMARGPATPRAPEHFKPLVGESARALEAWLNELFRQKITEGAIFRRIQEGRITEPLQDRSVYNIIRQRAKLVDPPLGKITAHSLRSGFVTESGRQNIPIGDAMALTGHRSVSTFIGYYRSGEVGNSSAARLMDSPEIAPEGSRRALRE